jgi:hypothetical protein
MKKSTKRTLFSKNRITLTVEDEKTDKPCVYSNAGTLYGSLSDGDSRYTKRTKCITKTITKKLESPLGFYYYKDETVSEIVEDDKVDVDIYWYEIILSSSLHYYTFRFPKRQGNISVSVDTRPWNIVSGCRSLEDHFIMDLFNDLEGIFFELEHDKAVVLSEKYDCEYRHTRLMENGQGLGEFKKNLYLIVFGNSKGPVYQTNDEKILSHGFDLKTSFRKDKEK